jgi:hypothetical protein
MGVGIYNLWLYDNNCFINIKEDWESMNDVVEYI